MSVPDWFSLDEGRISVDMNVCVGIAFSLRAGFGTDSLYFLPRDGFRSS